MNAAGGAAERSGFPPDAETSSALHIERAGRCRPWAYTGF